VELRQLPPVTLIDRSLQSPKGELETEKSTVVVTRIKRRPAFAVFSEPMKLAMRTTAGST